MIELAERVERSVDMIVCTVCKTGAAPRVPCTPQEIKKYDCWRQTECCARAFVCLHCYSRLVGKAHAPELRWED